MFAAQRTREIGQELKKMKHHFVDRFGSLDEVSILVPVKQVLLYQKMKHHFVDQFGSLDEVCSFSILVPAKQVLLYQ